MVTLRALLHKKNKMVEWVFTIAGGALSILVLVMDLGRRFL
jgi:hypothetical protein